MNTGIVRRYRIFHQSTGGKSDFVILNIEKPVSSAPVENAIRPVAVGRKNYLFAGSHDAAQRSAMIYSLLATCRLYNINPYEWREYYFANVKTKEHIENLGRKLYAKISEVIAPEVEDVTEQDCIDYRLQLVINRTFDGDTNRLRTTNKPLRLKRSPGIRHLYQSFSLSAAAAAR